MKCFWCETELTMVDASKHITTHWRCMECGATYWPGKTNQTEAEQLWNSEQAYKKSLAKLGGGGGSSSKGREKSKKKKANVWTEC